jgi:hypothetical protein
MAQGSKCSNKTRAGFCFSAVGSPVVEESIVGLTSDVSISVVDFYLSLAPVGLALRKPRDDTFLAQVIEEVRKHLFGIDAIVESGTPGLDRAGDIVETRIEDEVAESPGHYLLIRNRLKVVLSRHFCPEIALVSHIDGQRHRHRFGNIHIEHAGDAGPHESPAEVITIGDIEDFVLGRFCLARPSGGPGEDVSRTELRSFGVAFST